jgi:glycerol-3-phosphate acyltransferase PlsX
MAPGSPGRIAVDAMGGDLGPSEVVAAVKLALAQNPHLNPITLVGDEALLRPIISHYGLHRSERLSILHASEVITMEDKPLVALKRKKDSSMVRAIELVKAGEANVVVSCGNTGALMACGTLRLRTMEGVARPALAAVVPREGGHFVLIDAGANPEPKPEHLVHNSILGSHYCRVMLGIHSPRVGLMSIGTEDGKGNSLITETNELLKRIGGIIKYAGPIEGFQVFAEHVDVVVCDGFVGNIMLKSWESLAEVHFRACCARSSAPTRCGRRGRCCPRAPSPPSRTGSTPSATGAPPSSGCAATSSRPTARRTATRSRARSGRRARSSRPT